MSLHKPPRTPFYQFDFWCGGRRFLGSTKCRTRREAQKVEDEERVKAERGVADQEAAQTSLRLDDVAGRWWSEVGQHLAGAANAEGRLELLIQFFGKDRLVTDITDDDVIKFVAWRRGHPGKRKGTLVSPYTVNHNVEQLRALFQRCKLLGVKFQHEPRWGKHRLKVPSERVRELSEQETDALYAAMREDYQPFITFALITGMRLRECLLKWSQVDWKAEQIRKPGKGGWLVGTHITSEVRELLWPLQGHHPEFVFTYVPQRSLVASTKPPNLLVANNSRRPITYGGFQSEWRRLLKRSGVVNLHFHDTRHDFATNLLRATGNIKLVQKALHHRNIATTQRYAHCLDSDVAEALERVAKSRTQSRTRLKVV